MSGLLTGLLFCSATLFHAECAEAGWRPKWERWAPDDQWFSRIAERDGRAYRDRMKELYGTLPPYQRPKVPLSKSRYLWFDQHARPYVPPKPVDPAKELRPE